MSRCFIRLLLPLAAALVTAGCAGLAEDVATHLVSKDVKTIDQEIGVFKADLALFRECLKERGGSCQGATTTALPHSSQHAASQPVAPVTPGSSRVLADSVAKLPAGHPAKDAHAVLADPVVKQAAALHNHLRGHDGADVPGVSIEVSANAGTAKASTVTMDLKIGQGERLHHNLLASIGGTAWDSLHEHCRTVLREHRSDAELAADCRRATFIRGYLGAYFRHGEFVEVDVQLAGVIRALNDGAAEIEAEIRTLRGDVARLEQEVGAAKQTLSTRIGTAAGEVAGDVERLLGRIRSELEKRFGPAVGDVLRALSGLGPEAEGAARRLSTAAAAQADADVARLATALDGVLERIDAELGKLKTEVGKVDQSLVETIDDELKKADSALSNVFKVSNVGFVSRDATFTARLPTLEVTIDPTVEHLLTVEDVDTGQVLTRKSDLADLGVATDTSGVGTGDQIGAELLRVFLEAIYDAQEGLPAVYPANATVLEPTGLTLGKYSLPTFKAPMGDVDAQDLTRMIHLNDRVATQTRVLVGRVIEGVGPFNLNNPALESFLTELVATSVRKAAEKATWCFYACDLNVDLDRLRADVEQAARDKIREEEQRVDAAAQAAEDRARAFARREAEQIRLRLRLSR